MTDFVVYGLPQPRGSTRAFIVASKARVTDSNRPTLLPWLEAVKRAAIDQLERDPAARVEGPVMVAITFFLRRPKSAPKRRVQPDRKPDLDKLIRGVLDGLTGVLYHNDSQVTTLMCRKCYAGQQEDSTPTGLERAHIAVCADRAIQAWDLTALGIRGGTSWQ